MDKKQQLKEAIIAANPSIMELKFGCEVENGEGIEFILNHSKTKNHNEDKNVYEFNDEVIVFEPSQIHNPYRNGRFTSTYYAFQKNIKENEVKIIGRPITLADTLIAISKTLKDGDVLNGHVNMIGDFTFRPAEGQLIDWNLQKNTLDQQSEECLNFLHSIICE